MGWGRALTIGPVRLGLNDGTKVIKKADGDGAKKEEKVSPVLLLAAAIVVAFALYTSFSPNHNNAPSRMGHRRPAPLRRAPRAPPCAAEPALTRQSAEESTRVALSKAERMPFRMQDGVEAVLYYTQAASCYTATGDAALRRAGHPPRGPRSETAWRTSTARTASGWSAPSSSRAPKTPSSRCG